jgi:hypothetical protein
MNKQGSAGSTSTNTVRLHRVLAAKPDKVYRAFTTADAMARWLPPNGFTCTVHFEDPNLPGEMITTVTLRPVSVGTEINIGQEGLPAAIPLEACYLGWQQSLNHLAMLVEPEIKE